MLRSNKRVPRRLAVLAVGLAAVLAVPVGSSAAVAAVQPATTAVSSVAAAPVVGFPGNQVNYQYDSVRLQMTAGGGTTPYTWSAASLPLGLVINSSTGLISGVTRAAGTRTVTVTVKDAKGATGSTTFTWRVIRDACPLC
ncbi:Ig domain-containing protein [Streptomyces sp. NPDC051366]|uniref:Ig domain-containing protein n=1 Tax=Streptomyces sp. NPDC051366 TaxID=3365652 RepID=UPI0037A6C52E